MKTALTQLITVATFAALTSTSAMAKDSKTITKTLDIDSGQKISFNVPVGSLKIKTCQCDELSLKVVVEPKDSDWNFFSSSNVDDAQLSVQQQSGGMKLAINDEDTKQKWTVTVPHQSALDIELGVGEVDIRNFGNSLDADVGVGSIDVDVNEQNYQVIDLETGVGNTDVDGFDRNPKTKRAMVSSSTRYRSEGDHHIYVDVGVGDAGVSYH